MEQMTRGRVYTAFRALCSEAGKVCLDELNPDDRPKAGAWRLKYAAKKYIIAEVDASGDESYPMGTHRKPAREMYGTLWFAYYVLRNMKENTS